MIIIAAATVLVVFNIKGGKYSKEKRLSQPGWTAWSKET